MERLLRRKLRGGKFVNVSPERSRIMASVRSKRNKSTEIPFRMALIRAGLNGWTMNTSNISGCPDFYFTKQRLCIFIDGCFWHGCSRCGHTPKTNRAFWAAKLDRNRERDLKNSGFLKRRGYRVLRFWEHEIEASLHSCIEKLLRTLH